MNIFIKTLLYFLYLASFNLYAACEDQPTNEVDWSNCNFMEMLDLSGVSLANAQMSGVNLALVNFEKSQINNANMSFGNFILGNFNNSNLFSANMQYANCNNTVFDNANLAKVNFEGANLFMSSFKGANLFEVNLLGANIANANFEEANLSHAIWIDGRKCALGSVGQCD